MTVLARPTRSIRAGLLSTLLFLSGTCPSIAAEPITIATPQATLENTTADAVQEAFVRAAERIKPSIVTIYAERAASASPDTDATPPGASGKHAGLGTGMVVDTHGAILTNYHVVKEATLIRVVFNADSERPTRLLAKLAGFDEESDLAVLQLTNPAGIPLTPVEFADSDVVRVGEWAIAVGAPFDQAHTITVGIISAKGRYLEKNDRPSLQDYLQTDASINPGNSGGPLLNLSGKVIGINTAILSPSQFNVGIGFALPSNTIRRYWPVLNLGKTIERGFLGIRYVALDADVAREFNIRGGMQVSAFAREGESYLGPAHDAGLATGDIITRVDSHHVTSIKDFRQIMEDRPPGAKIELTVLRPLSASSQTTPITVVLGDWPAPQKKSAAPVATDMRSHARPFSRTGLLLKDAGDLSEAERLTMNVATRATGVFIIDVLPGSPADIAQISRGLKIEKIRHTDRSWRTILNTSDFLELEKALSSKSNLLLTASDKDAQLYKMLTIP